MDTKAPTYEFITNLFKLDKVLRDKNFLAGICKLSKRNINDFLIKIYNANIMEYEHREALINSLFNRCSFKVDTIIDQLQNNERSYLYENATNAAEILMRILSKNHTDLEECLKTISVSKVMSQFEKLKTFTNNTEPNAKVHKLEYNRTYFSESKDLFISDIEYSELISYYNVPCNLFICLSFLRNSFGVNLIVNSLKSVAVFYNSNGNYIAIPENLFDSSKSILLYKDRLTNKADLEDLELIKRSSNYVNTEEDITCAVLKLDDRELHEGIYYGASIYSNGEPHYETSRRVTHRSKSISYPIRILNIMLNNFFEPEAQNNVSETDKLTSLNDKEVSTKGEVEAPHIKFSDEYFLENLGLNTFKYIFGMSKNMVFFVDFLSAKPYAAFNEAQAYVDYLSTPSTQKFNLPPCLEALQDIDLSKLAKSDTSAPIAALDDEVIRLIFGPLLHSKYSDNSFMGLSRWNSSQIFFDILRRSVDKNHKSMLEIAFEKEEALNKQLANCQNEISRIDL